MSDLRIVSLETLLARLEQVLGPNSLLLQRFRRGLQEEDERCLSDAMTSLQLYPAATRQEVEETVMCCSAAAPSRTSLAATPGRPVERAPAGRRLTWNPPALARPLHLCPIFSNA